MKIIVKHFFDSAHQLKDSPDLVTKACARLHGHTYAVKVETYDTGLNKAGMVVDFKAIKNIIDELDHRFINDILEVQPTAENIALWFKERFRKDLGIESTVAVCEGYKGENKSSWVIA